MPRSLSIFFVVFAALHLIAAYITPFGVDEAHYAVYGLHPALSYFDHPPLVGWIQWLFLNLGESEFVLRLAPMALSLFSLILLYRMVREDFDTKTANLSLWLLSTTLGFQILSLGMVPDVALSAAALMVFYAIRKLVQAQSIGLWLLLAFALGLSGLAKYSAVILGFSVAIALYFRYGWVLLASPQLWMAVAIGLAMISPVIIWNVQNDWVSFGFQTKHVTAHHAFSIKDGLTMQAQQLLAYGPLLYGFGLLAMIRVLRQPSLNKPAHLYVIFALPVFVFFSIAAFKGRALPHWTYMGVFFITPVVAQTILQQYKNLAPRLFIWFGALYSGIIVLAVHAILLLPGIKYPDYQHPLYDMQGWSELGPAINVLMNKDDLAHKNLYVTSWDQASRLAWYARPMPVKALGSGVNQFSLWFGEVKKGDSGYVILQDRKDELDLKALDQFDKCIMMNDTVMSLNNAKTTHMAVYRCDSYLGQK